MRITHECDYAIRIVLLLAKDWPESKKDAKSISDEQKIPLRFTVKILRKLNQAGILKSYKGASGGYVLNKDPNLLSLNDIVNVIDGEICINRCFGDRANCGRLDDTNLCSVHKALDNVQSIIRNELQEITFKRLLT